MEHVAPMAVSPAAEAEIAAHRCAFDVAELRWLAATGAEPLCVRLLRGQGGALSLDLGGEELALAEVRSVSLLGPSFLMMQTVKQGQIGLRSPDEAAMRRFHEALLRCKENYERFEQFEQSSVQNYFQYYSKLANQQNMLQDSVRTTTYRQAIMENPDDFKGRSIMDIGAGSGILSFFSAQAGAEHVYCVEASSMAEVVRLLADSNSQCFSNSTFTVLRKPLELVTEDEIAGGKVDCLVSEPIGTFLFNERMIESYLCARDRFLKPGGKMFPNVGNLFIAPFSDPVLHWEQSNKNVFWRNNNFYGLDLNAAVNRSTREHFRQPIVDYINPECLVSQAHLTRFDFMTCTVESLQDIEIPFDFEIFKPCLVHGIAGWFDCIFEGENTTVTLSTAPWCPGTHWYQIRFLLETPLAVNAGQRIEGTLKMEANKIQSYYVRVHMQIKGTSISSESAQIDLKDPEYRFYSSQNTYIPPGTPVGYGQQANAQAACPSYQQSHFAQTQMAPPSAPPQVQQSFGAAWSNGQQQAPCQQPQQQGAIGQTWAAQAMQYAQAPYDGAGQNQQMPWQDASLQTSVSVNGKQVKHRPQSPARM